MIKKDSFLYEFLYNEAPKENPDVDSAQDNNPGGAPGQMSPMGGNNPGMNDMPPMDGGNGAAPAGPQGGGDGQVPPMDNARANDMPPMDNGGAPTDIPPMGPDMPESGAGEEETTIDVDDLTQAQEKLNDKVNALGHNTSTMTGNLEKVMSMISTLTDRIDANNKEIEAFKAEMEKRNPTQKEKLELRTRVSAPFDVPVEEYWNEFEKTHPNYEVSQAGSSRQDGKDQYIITRQDANDYDPYEIEQSLLGNPLFEEKAIRQAIRKALKEGAFNLEDQPEYRPEGDKYFKYRVCGHIFKKTPKGNYVDYPCEEFDNIEDARACAERYKRMPDSVPDNVRIQGFYKTLSDDDWEYIR